MDAIVTSVDPTRLPYEQISQPAIREAVAGFDAAKTALDESKKALVAAQQELPQSQWADAEAAEKARAEGKPEPKTRSHTQQHERLIENLEHEQRVCALAVQRTERALVDAIDKHGSEWGTEVEEACSALLEQWHSAVVDLTALHAHLSTAFAVRRQVVEGKQPRIGVLEFAAGQVQGREWAGGQGPGARPVVQVGDVLAGLAEIGTIAPEPPVVQQPPLSTAGGDARLLSMDSVQREISERRDREAAVEERRQQLLAAQDDEG
jgi:hypothetical protein